MGKGGGGSAPTQQTVTQTNLPEYARPYFENIMNRAQAQSYQQYVPYQNERTAYFTPGQLQTQQEVMGMQDPSQLYDASNIAYNTAMQSMQAGQHYQPGQFGLSGFRDVNAERVGSRDIQAAQSAYRPELKDIYTAAPERVSTYDISTAQLGDPQQFNTQIAQQYMSPYMQNVVDIQKREALRDAQIAQLGQNLAAPRQGTYGGARQALLTGERERGLRTQLGDIQSTGSEKAFGQAQQQFERDRAAQMQSSLAKLNVEAQNAANRLQAAAINQQAALQAALANQQAGLQTQQLKTQSELQVEMANLTNQQQAAVQNEANRLQASGMNQQAALQAALANQQGDLASQQAGLQAQQMGEQSRQFGANLGLQGLQQAMAGAQTLGGLGTAQQDAQLRRLQAQGAVGAEQRGYQQQLLDQAYGDFLRQRDYPMEQLGYFSNLMRGIPVGLSSTQTSYAAPPSAASQLTGAGLSALGLSRLAGG